MASIKLRGDTSGEITISAPGVAGTNTLELQATSGTIATTAQSSVGTKNLVINGDMRIDQRNAGASVTITSSLYTLDRWQATQSVSSKYSVQQVTDAPVGATHSLKATSLSAYTVGTSESFVIRQQIEGNNIAHLGWGTANAKTVTLSFWVKSSLTGTFGAIIKSNAGGRTYPITYDINSANTWEQKSITITGDTAGTWLTTNGVGIQVVFNIGTGATLSGTANTWSSTNYNSATGATSLLATNGATLQISLIQLEVGTTATPFENLMYSQQLAMCQRYFETSFAYGQAVPTSTFDGMVAPGYSQASSTTGEIGGQVNFQTKKRAAPTVTIYDQSSNSGKLCRTLIGSGNFDNETASVTNFNDRGGLVYGASGNNASYTRFHFKAEAEL